MAARAIVIHLTDAAGDAVALVQQMLGAVIDQQLAVVDDEDVFQQPLHLADQVGREQDAGGRLAVALDQQLVEQLPVEGVHPQRRLVEQQQRGVDRQRQHHPQHRFVAGGEFEVVLLQVQLELLGVVQALLLVKAGVGGGHPADDVPHLHLGKICALGGKEDLPLRLLVFPDALLVQQNLAGGGLEAVGDHPQQGGLARAVAPQQAADHRLGQGEADLVDSGLILEGLGDRLAVQFHLENPLSIHSCSC